MSQYRTIISELRDEIARLKSKMPDDKIIMENIHRDRFKIEDDEFKKKEIFVFLHVNKCIQNGGIKWRLNY